MTGLGIPGVNQHPPDVMAQLRNALAAFDATRGAKGGAAWDVVDAARAVLAEVDAEVHAGKHEAPANDPYCARHAVRFDPEVGCPACLRDDDYTPEAIDRASGDYLPT